MIPGGQWFEPDGLRFECTSCGACCTGAPGYVTVTDEEAARIAARLGLPVASFRERFARREGAGWSLGEVKTEHGYDCVFLDRDSVPGKAICAIYEDRPLQCRTFPWWPEHLRSERAWRRLARRCEGVGRGGFVPVEEITVQRARQRGVDKNGSR